MCSKIGQIAQKRKKIHGFWNFFFIAQMSCPLAELLCSKKIHKRPLIFIFETIVINATFPKIAHFFRILEHFAKNRCNITRLSIIFHLSVIVVDVVLFRRSARKSGQRYMIIHAWNPVTVSSNTWKNASGWLGVLSIRYVLKKYF